MQVRISETDFGITVRLNSVRFDVFYTAQIINNIGLGKVSGTEVPRTSRMNNRDEINAFG